MNFTISSKTMSSSRRSSSPRNLMHDLSFYRRTSRTTSPLKDAPSNCVSHSSDDDTHSGDGSVSSTQSVRTPNSGGASSSNTTNTVDVATDTIDLEIDDQLLPHPLPLIREYRIDADNIRRTITSYLSYMRDAHAVYRTNTPERVAALERAMNIYDYIHGSISSSQDWYDNFFVVLDEFIRRVDSNGHHSSDYL